MLPTSLPGNGASRRSVLAAGAALAAFCAFPLRLFARTVTDDLNRTVTLAERPQRIVVADIYPFASLVAMLLPQHQLVGIHPVSMSAAQKGLLGKVRPAVLKADTGFMRGSEINIELLLSLAPDVVFVNASNKRAVARLEAASIPVVAVSATQRDYDVFATFRGWVTLLQGVFGDAVNAAAFNAAADRMTALVNERTKDMEPKDKKRVLFLVQYDERRMVTSGRRFFGQFWCEAARAENAAQAITAENAAAVINLEQVYAWNPDVIFLTNFTQAVPEDLYENKWHDWSTVKAVQTRAVHKMPLGLYRSFTPSADSPLTLLWFAKTLYPERFADLDMTKETIGYYKELFDFALTPAQASDLFAVRQS